MSSMSVLVVVAGSLLFSVLIGAASIPISSLVDYAYENPRFRNAVERWFLLPTEASGRRVFEALDRRRRSANSTLFAASLAAFRIAMWILIGMLVLILLPALVSF